MAKQMEIGDNFIHIILGEKIVAHSAMYTDYVDIAGWYSGSTISERVSEWGLTSPPTQHKLSGRRFYRSKDTANSIEVLKEQGLQSEYTVSEMAIFKLYIHT